MFGFREGPEAGGLLSYGPDLNAAFRRCAVYVDKIIKGAKPSELPVEQMSIFILTVNLNTANALGHHLPSISGFREFTEAGGLLSYGPDVNGAFRHCALYVHKIIKGAKPSELPVEQASTFVLTVNLKTAKTLGLTVPPSLLARADEVIE